MDLKGLCVRLAEDKERVSSGGKFFHVGQKVVVENGIGSNVHAVKLFD